MLVSWDWLKQYVALDMDREELENRLAMSGLNHEGSEPVGSDIAIDLEVTSNRPDCLGHIGVAREIAVLYNQALTLPSPQPDASGPDVNAGFSVSITAPELCPRYTARIIRGVTIKGSPTWMQDQLRTVFLPINRDWKPINNVADITNYVLMEAGQPLHAFDLGKLVGEQINVRAAEQGEKFEAIDHREYELQAEMCVIADGAKSIAIAGVMGGAETEVNEQTVDVLIESADFTAMSIRATSRALNLHSPSSYRFERALDPAGVDWASQRCCELILEHCGGTLDTGVIEAGESTWQAEPVVLRLSQVERILGIKIDAEEVRSILIALGNAESASTAESITVTPPTWRRDLSRECDLLEEIARIHGYEKIPEDVGVPMAASFRSDEDRVAEVIRTTLTATGFDESLTGSVVPLAWTEQFNPWATATPLRTISPMLQGADALRTSLAPSLLEVRRINQSLANPAVELFETAKIYLPQAEGLPQEQKTIGLTSSGDFYHLKGVIESLLAKLKITTPLSVAVAGEVFDGLLDNHQRCTLLLGDEILGFLGQVSKPGLKTFSLKTAAMVAELKMDLLVNLAMLIPQHQDLSAFPAISRDLNVVLQESVHWDHLQATVEQAAGEALEFIGYQETYRAPDQDGANTKRVLFNVKFRRGDATMTGEEADAIRDTIVQAIAANHNGKLLGV
jgi:phenylalanyl-tRNA synthetase beta chain